MLGVKMRQLRSEDVGNLRSSGRVRLSKLFHHERMRLAEIDRDSSDGRDRLVQLRPKAHELIDPFAPVRSIRPRPKIDLLDRPNPRGGCHEQRIKVGKVTKYGSLRHPGTPGDLSGARQVYRVGRAFPHDVENGTHNGLIVADHAQPATVGFLVARYPGRLTARALMRPVGTSAVKSGEGFGARRRASAGSAPAPSGSWWPEHGRLWCPSKGLTALWASLWSRASPSVTSG